MTVPTTTRSANVDATIAEIRVGEEDIRAPLAELSLELLRRCQPVRRPAAYRGQRHMPGRWYSTTTGSFCEYESLLERDRMLLMDFDPEVVGMIEQPLRLFYERDGSETYHVPDLLVWRLGRRPLLCDVKSRDGLASTRFKASRVATEAACREASWDYEVLSEPDEQLLANVRWLAGFRHAIPDPHDERQRMIAELRSESLTIEELLEDAAEPMLARPVLMGMLWRQEASVELGEPLEDTTLVWLEEGTRWVS
jgi:hypothetical protein